MIKVRHGAWESGSFFAICGVTIVLAVLLSIISARTVGATYIPNLPESGFEAKQKQDPKVGALIPEISRFGLSENKTSIIIVLGNCAPCAIAKIENIPSRFARSGRIFLVANSEESAKQVVHSGFEEIGFQIRVGNEEFGKRLNAFFLPRSYVFRGTKMIAAPQSPFELTQDYVERWKRP